MPAKSRIPKDLWETYRAMSVDVGRENKFLAKTACMNQEQRATIALLNTAKRVVDDSEFSAFVDEYMIPHVQELGNALWGRDVVTDLGFALSGRKSQIRKINKILKAKFTLNK